MSTTQPLHFHPLGDIQGGKIQPRRTTGRYNSLRWLMVALTQAVFYGLCWLPWDGRQAVLFNLDERKFYLFDLVLWPQDVLYLALLLIIAAAALFAVTAVAGRLFCGFACPQTVYTALFMGIESRIEGDRAARLKLDASPWTGEKILRRGGKHLAWLSLAAWTGVTFVGYFTPIRELLPSLGQWQSGPWEAFWVLFYGAFTYMQAGFLREKVCQHMCPYSRFQGVMFDPQTLNVGYDVLRGEPRGARREDGSANSAISAATPQRKGDCVDCTLCVQVCPTGIDIRQGLQYACISCGLCIDACNKVMDKIGLARGLIRFDSLQRLEQGIAVPFRFWRPRVIAYTVLISAMAVALVVGLAQRIPLRVDVLRERNALAREVDDGWVENIYTVKLANMAEMPRRFKLAVSGLPDAHIEGPDEIASGPGELTPVVLTVRARPEQQGRHARPLTLNVTALDAPEQVHVRETTPFLLP